MTKHRSRKIRVLRLLAVVQAYHYYTIMQMNRELLQHDNDWQSAEHMSHWVNAMMPHKECSPTDFLYNKNELYDTVIDNYEELKKWKKIAETVGISEQTLTAFCENVENMHSIFRLKIFGHIFYPEWLMYLYLYLDNGVSKTELQSAFVEYSLFSGKAKPANIAEFRKVVRDIENNIAQIMNKQICSNIQTQII